MNEKPLSLIRHCDDVICSELDSEIVLLKPETGDCYSLRGVGAEVWRTAETPSSISQITDAVCRRFDVAPEDARDDIEHFVEEMTRERLILREPLV